MNTRFIIATKNKGKLLEMQEILKDLPFEVLSMEEAGFHDEIEETGSTFEENSMIKARAIFNKTGGIVMADDSGLEIDFLGGAPGIFSARFAGEKASEVDKINKVLGLLQAVPVEKRSASFVCSISLIINHSEHFTLRASCEGLITTKPFGDNGFGYDPIFFLPDENMTMAQIPPEVKNRISHRGKALQEMKKRLAEIL